jgi:hypothetical protein
MRRNRIMVTISPAMHCALELLAERTGIPLATQAAVVLRMALDRTIQSAEGRARLRARLTGRTRNEWVEDTVDGVELERSYGKHAEATWTAATQPDAVPAAPAEHPDRPRARRKAHRVAVDSVAAGTATADLDDIPY